VGKLDADDASLGIFLNGGEKMGEVIATFSGNIFLTLSLWHHHSDIITLTSSI
jgi:hypothetical protein